MAMNISDFKDFLISNMDGVTVNAAMVFSDAVIDYITQNMIVNYSWTGVNPSGAPDPVLVTKSSSIEATVPFTAPPVDFITMFGPSGLDLRLKGLVITVGDSAEGWALAPNVLNPAASLLPIVNQLSIKPMNNFRDIMGQLAADIITSLKSVWLPVAPSAGTHAAFTGTAIATSIT